MLRYVCCNMELLFSLCAVQTLSPCIQNSVWPTLSSLLEIISYRVHKHLSTPTNLGILNNLAPLMKTSAVLPTQLKLRYVQLYHVTVLNGALLWQFQF